MSNGQFEEKALLLTDFDELIQAEKTSGSFLPRCIQLDWCICNVKDNFKVVEVVTVIVNPGIPINAETTEATGVSQEKIDEEGVDFDNAITKVSIK